MSDLTAHFALVEFYCRGQAPPTSAIPDIRRLCAEVLEPLRAAVERPIRITSGWRTPEHNTAIGGRRRSAHLLGWAADIKIDPPEGKTSANVLMGALWKMRDSMLFLDQAIGYDPGLGGHVHVAIHPSGAARGQFLWCVGKNEYVPWEGAE